MRRKNDDPHFRKDEKNTVNFQETTKKRLSIFKKRRKNDDPLLRNDEKQGKHDHFIQKIVDEKTINSYK